MTGSCGAGAAYTFPYIQVVNHTGSFPIRCILTSHHPHHKVEQMGGFFFLSFILRLFFFFLKGKESDYAVCTYQLES